MSTIANRCALLLLFIYGQLVLGQTSITDTIIELANVEVNSQRMDHFDNEMSVETFDSLLLQSYNSKSLGDVLTASSGVSIRSYGVSGLASMSMRGGTSGQSTVIWNDLNLQNPMNAGVNLSTLPILFSDKVQVLYGGAGALNGSGDMSGSVHLSSNNVISKCNSLKVGSSIGSFENYSGYISAKTGNKKYGISGKFFGKKAENDFRFINTAQYGDPSERQTNSATRQLGAGVDQQVLLAKNLYSNTSILFTDYFTHIPTRMDDSKPSKNSQADKNIYATTNLKLITNNNSLCYRFGYLFSEVDYADPDSITTDTGHSFSTTHSFINELESKWVIQNQYIIIGLNYTNERAAADAFLNIPIRNRGAAYLFYNIKDNQNRSSTSIKVRQERTNDNQFPLVYSIGSVYNATKLIGINGNLARTYRIPSFNDLYWKDGMAEGNPSLKPESGWSGELGLSEYSQFWNGSMSFSQTLFYNEYKNYIAWLPDSIGVWKPDNKKVGKSYGIELKAKNQININEWLVELKAAYSYTKSLIYSNDEYNEKSMLYVPKHKVNGSFLVVNDVFSGRIILNYNGRRYFDSRNALPAYITADAMFNMRYKVASVEINTSLNVYNFLNANYQVMNSYAMPQRNYTINVEIKL